MTESKLILEAIAQRYCLEATYNRVRIKLAPHILYTKHDDLFIDAVALERDGKAPGELKLGTFKLTGLRDAELIRRQFDRFRGFDPADPRYHETTLLAVE